MINPSSRRLLPPMGALQCLEAAARHDSFSLAAQDIGLSQSAISRQIATLENWLGISLFDRIGRRVRLTQAGHAYIDAIAPALSRVRSATAAVLEHQHGNVITIATLPSFGMRWLAPRLPRFSAAHPDVIVNFLARTLPFGPIETGLDGAIHFGLPDWPNAVHTKLFHEVVIPVIAPSLLERHRLAEPSDLFTIPLLSLQSRRDAWSRWFNLADVSVDRPIAGASHEQFMMLAQAAVAGLGAALIPKFLIEPELTSGALTIPFPIELSSEEAYYFVRGDGAESPALRAFEAWLLTERPTSPTI